MGCRMLWPRTGYCRKNKPSCQESKIWKWTVEMTQKWINTHSKTQSEKKPRIVRCNLNHQTWSKMWFIHKYDHCLDYIQRQCSCEWQKHYNYVPHRTWREVVRVEGGSMDCRTVTSMPLCCMLHWFSEIICVKPEQDLSLTLTECCESLNRLLAAIILQDTVTHFLIML